MKNLLKSIFILVIIYVVFFISNFFTKTTFFNITEIKLDTSELLQRDVIDKLNNLKGENLFYLNISKIEETLKEDVRIESINIKKIYPSKLIVILKEKKVKYYLKNKENIYLSNEKLDIFGYIFEMKENNIPVVVFNEENKDTIENLKIITTKIIDKEIYSIISEIKRNGKEYELILNNSVKIITDPLVNSEKYDNVFKVYEKIKDKRPILYMDIRFNDIVVKHN